MDEVTTCRYHLTLRMSISMREFAIIKTQHHTPSPRGTHPAFDCVTSPPKRRLDRRVLAASLACQIRPSARVVPLSIPLLMPAQPTTDIAIDSRDQAQL